MVQTLLLYGLAFVLLWVGSGIVVAAITKISHILRMSSFVASFFILGFFTSITEIMVGINAYLNNASEIFVGNLIGSSAVIFLFIIPLLAVIAKNISFNHSFEFSDLVTAICVVGLPSILTLDNQITVIDGLLCVATYLYFVFTQENKHRSLNKLVHINLKNLNLYSNLGQILVAMAIIFIGSNILVNQTRELGHLLGISPYVISVLVISVGTNIPELSIAIRALLSKKKDVALGDYIGSATLNTLELGTLSMLGLRPVPAEGSNYSILAFLLGLAVFIYYAKENNSISRLEGLIILACYVSFIAYELLTGPGWML
jgi:cation:H+ antiporter